MKPSEKQCYIDDLDNDGFISFNVDRSLGQNQYAYRYSFGEHGGSRSR